MIEYRVEGTADHEAMCDRCGATLKQAIVLASMDLDGNPCGYLRYFGADCAATLTGLSQQAVRLKAQVAEQARQAGLRRDRKREADRRLQEQREREWLQENYGADDMTAAAESSGKEWLTVFDEYWAWEMRQP
ncbi:MULTISPECIES: hypothetical protein [unclassified Kitasatospora]|uniref:hypothetical protein n=1 Tax=unclassified Kitasatospora TaxID=2633591 RepID=UPI00343A1D21